MFVKQLIVVGCFLFAVEFLEAKNINRYKKTSIIATRQSECADDQKKCPTSDKCIRISYFCDGDNDCGDFSDEQNCGPMVCSDSDKAACPNIRRCINKRYFCDTDNDCGDNSDEEESFCRTRTCQPNQISCNNGQCLDKDGFCSGEYSCRDGTLINHVEICGPLVCSDSEKDPCPNIRRCINKRYFCDNDNDCGDNSDEEESFCRTRTCQPSQVRCNNGQCLEKDGFCRSEFSCRDGSLSSNGEICADIPFPCSDSDAQCPNIRRCINKRYFCDNDNDCGDNSDEEASFCSTRTCQPNEVRCNNGQCLNKEGFCRSQYSCRDGSLSTESEICGVGQRPPQPGPSGPFEQGGPSPAEMQCYMAMMEFQSTCLNFPFVSEIKNLSPDAIFEKLTEIDMRELCGYVQQPLQCAKNAFSQCSNIANPMIQSVNQQLSLAEQLFNSVCVQEIDIINRHKACLLRKADGPPVPLLAIVLEASCSHTLPPNIDQTLCLPESLFACGKNVVAQQCGDEIAGAIDRIGQHFTCPSYHKRSKSEPLKKRTPAFPFQRSFFKKYFF